jgi:hypothetical protein
MGLQYAPSFRALEKLWTSKRPEVVAKLRRVAPRHGLVRPADLDSALQSFEVTEQISGASLTGQTARVPFAIDEAQLLTRSAHQMWALTAKSTFTEGQEQDAVRAFLGAQNGTATAHLDGYRARALQAQDVTEDSRLERHAVPWTATPHIMLSSQKVVQQVTFLRGMITAAMYDLVDGHSALPNCALFPLSAHLEMASFSANAASLQESCLGGAVVLRPLILSRPSTAEW